MTLIPTQFGSFGSGQPFYGYVVHIVCADTHTGAGTDGYLTMQKIFNNRFCSTYPIDQWPEWNRDYPDDKVLCTVNIVRSEYNPSILQVSVLSAGVDTYLEHIDAVDQEAYKASRNALGHLSSDAGMDQGNDNWGDE